MSPVSPWKSISSFGGRFSLMRLVDQEEDERPLRRPVRGGGVPAPERRRRRQARVPSGAAKSELLGIDWYAAPVVSTTVICALVGSLTALSPWLWIVRKTPR